jgi:serpin B
MRCFMGRLVPLVLLAACHGGPGGELVMSSRPRLSAASVPPANVATQSQDDARFAFDLYAQLKATSGNLFFSPYSLSSALGMTWAGAAGDTASAMAASLRFSLPLDRALGAFNATDAALASRAQSQVGTERRPFQLDVVNAIWAQRGLPLEAPFLDRLAENFGAGVRLEDFARSAEPARADINAWVREETAGLIPMLLGPTTITAATRLVLTNAVFFSAAWMPEIFTERHTQPAPFHALDGSTPMVPLMHAVLATAYALGDGWQAVEIPYANPDLTLTVIVPEPGRFGEVESLLSGAFLAQVLAAESDDEVTLALPRFQAETHASVGEALGALGMGQAFSSDADFSGIDGQRDLQLADVIHQATISVDERGTQVTAATAVTALEASTYAVTPATLTIDRPFVLALRDRPTGAVLFLGRIVQP